MSFYGFPSADLPVILSRYPAAHIIATVPLEPSSRVFMIYPSFFSPERKRLGSINTKIIEFRIMKNTVKLCFSEPIIWEFFCTIGHVFAPKNTHLKHLFGSKVRNEIRTELFAARFRKIIYIFLLHTVIYNDLLGFHC